MSEHIEDPANPSSLQGAAGGLGSPSEIDSPVRLVIIGGGPRAVSVLERLAQAVAVSGALAGSRGLEIHVVEPKSFGAGRVWQPEQTPSVCMNTLADAVTIFGETASGLVLGATEGPTLYEWALAERTAARAGNPSAVYRGFAPEVAAELDQLTPYSHPSRALFGSYLTWAFHTFVERLSASHRVTLHQARVTEIRSGSLDPFEPGAFDVVVLSNGTELPADAIIAATGWGEQPPAEHPSRAAYVGPDSPIEQKLELVKPGARAIVRGTGMSFFDLIALLYLDRGGSFELDPENPTRLVFHPGPGAPVLQVTSRRGLPFLPKSEYHQLPPKAELPRLRAIVGEIPSIAAHREAVPAAERVSFREVLWPAIIRDAWEAYLRTAAKTRGLTLDWDSVLDGLASHEISQLGAYVAGVLGEASPIELIPAAPRAASVAELTAAYRERIDRELSEAEAGIASPRKAALWVISAARKPVSLFGENGRLLREEPLPRAAAPLSGALTYEEFMAWAGYAGSGPPAFRTRELLALIDAGFITFLGGDVAVEETGAQWRATSPDSGREPVTGEVLVDAWMHSPDVRRAPGFFDSIPDRWRLFSREDAQGHRHPTGTVETDPTTRRLVRPDGQLDPRIHLIGIPTHGQFGDTTIAPMPRTNPRFIQETDAVVADVLSQFGS